MKVKTNVKAGSKKLYVGGNFKLEIEGVTAP
jgi:hypothetical protein